METYSTLEEALNSLKGKGYNAEFELQTDCLYCSSLDMRLNEEEFSIDAVYHFDNYGPAPAAVYAMTSPTGVKGLVIDRSATAQQNGTCTLRKNATATRSVIR